MSHEHKYERLSDEAIFCKCGDIKVVGQAACPLPHYPVWYPSYPFWTQPWRPSQPYWIWNGTTTTNDMTIGDTEVGWGNVTFTAIGDVSG